MGEASQLQRLLAPRGVSNDPEYRRERARKAGKAGHTIDAHIAAVVRRAGELTPEQIDVLRSILPAPDNTQAAS